MTSKNSIAKNAGFLMISQVVTWLLALVLTIFLPRYLGATAVGQLHLAESLWAILITLAAFGMNQYLTKEIARQPERVESLFGTTVLLRSLLYLATMGLLAGYLALVDYQVTTVYVILIIGVANLFWTLASAAQATLQGLERMEYISVGNVVGKIFNTVVAIVLLLLGFQVLVISAVVVGTAVLTFVVQYLYLRRLAPIGFRPDLSIARSMLVSGLPYLFVSISLVAYMQVDVVIISLLVNETVVGWYGAADRLFGTLLFIPMVFRTALYPVLARSFQDTPDKMVRMTSKSFDLLLLLSLPIGLGIVVVAGPLVILLFGEDFVQSGPVLAVFGIVLILTYQNVMVGNYLISADRQSTWAIVMAVATLATVPIDLVLVPWCQAAFGNGAIGGALAFVITEAGMLVTGIYLLPRGTLGRENLWLALRALGAAVAMAAVAWFLRDAFILIPVVAGAATYGFLVWLFGLVPADDREYLTAFARRVLAKVRASEPEPAGS